MKKIVSSGIFIFFLLCTCIFSVSAENTKDKPEEVQQHRNFKSKKSFISSIDLLNYIFEIPWYPIKKFLNFSEKTDLINRTIDLFYFNDEKTFGWFPAISSGTDGITGYGLSLFHHNLFYKKQKINISSVYETSNQLLIKTAYTINSSKSNPNHFKAEFNFLRDDNVEIYTREDPSGNVILGSKTLRLDRKSYFSQEISAQLKAGRRLSAHLDFTTTLLYKKVETKPVNASILPGTLQGLNETADLMGTNIDLSLNFLDNPIRPFKGHMITVGGFLLSSIKRTQKGNRYGLSGYSVTGRHFLPLYFPHRSILFQYSLKKLENLESQKIPFYEHPVLDYNNNLRSFERRRFQNTGALSINLEYRYPIWVTWDAFIFIDAGQSFDTYSNITVSDFNYSQGFGIRFMSRDALLFIMQTGFGDEGIKMRISLGQVF